MGMTAIRYRGISDDTGDDVDGHHVIDHHDELLGVLGLAAGSPSRRSARAP